MAVEDLDTLRKSIDHIDDQLLKLIEQRVGVAKKAKKAKKDSVIYRPERELAILKRMAESNTSSLSDASVQAIFSEIIAACRNAQRSVRIACLGPAGTFSEESALNFFGTGTSVLAVSSMHQAVKLVENDSADIAWLPIENSSEGSVVETHKILMNTNLNILHEDTIAIRHNLITNTKDISKIKEVHGHPQALGQCREWLDQNMPDARRVGSLSNSAAIKLCQESEESDLIAAIGSAKAATQYGVPVAAESIQDSSTNSTRFIALSKIISAATGNDKTSLLVHITNEAGSLYDILSVFSNAGISMTRLESWPVGIDEYAFFIDIEGHIDDEPVAKALQNIKSQAKLCKIIGSYPRKAVK
jgi:chorismate mutase/prephenate dehydratase